MPARWSVITCAEQLHLSPNYYGDMVKKEIGKTASEYIQLKVMAIAKEKILDVNRSISEIAYDLPGVQIPCPFYKDV
ncbi:AraC family transcriptional regulator [Mucilaginibacter sp. MD40]|uniref:helix-turn-helix domain-containing protein n=1 Tax=Mucilaginibacter sp. MD40 TaxID=2029590 RepID=UPI0018EA28ED|nr:AraC family transcriptional regulator [Mucilaginibacter sp. MD40]